jgi:hypothetical protein
MAKSPEEMKASMIAGLQEKTGKPLEEWLQILRATNLTKHKEIVSLLKTRHGLTHGYANMVALQFLQSDSQTATDTDALVAAQYAGAKAGLLPIYEAVIAAANTLGKDVVISPKKAYVSLRRSKQFALVQPSTASRIDIGLVLKNIEAKGRLEASGSFNAMVTHRVRVSKRTEVDKELLGWLRQAYQEA